MGVAVTIGEAVGKTGVGVVVGIGDTFDVTTFRSAMADELQYESSPAKLALIV